MAQKMLLIVAMTDSEAPIVLPGRSSSKVLIIGLGLVAVVAMGAAGYFAFLKKPEVDAKPKDAAAKAAQPDLKLGVLVELQPIVTNLSDPSVGRFIRVRAFVEVGNDEDKALIEKYMVPIRDHLVIYFSELPSERTLAAGEKAKMQKEIAESLNKMLTKSVVQRVFFNEFVVQ